jgi:hypothetical protein
MTRTLEEIKDELFQSLGRQIIWLRSIQDDLVAETYTPADARLDLDALGTEGFDWMSLLGEMGYFEQEEQG